MPKKTTAEIIASDNDYIIQVKGNQKNLHKQIVLNTQQDNKAIDTFTESTNKRGRQEIRKTSIYTNLEGISDEWDQPKENYSSGTSDIKFKIKNILVIS